MFVMRLLLLFLLGLVIRRVYRAVRTAKRSLGAKQTGIRSEKIPDEGFRDLTEQGIDDADFEEIP